METFWEMASSLFLIPRSITMAPQSAEPPRTVRTRSSSEAETADPIEDVEFQIALQGLEPETKPPHVEELRRQQTIDRSLAEKKNEKKLTNLWGFADIGSEILENKGAVARDHMANERTFLSWIRTSLGLATVGVGITQLFKLVDEKNSKTDTPDFLLRAGKPIGGTFIAIAIVCTLMGTMRFFRTQEYIKEGKYPASRVSVSILVFLVLSLTVATFGLVVHTDT